MVEGSGTSESETTVTLKFVRFSVYVNCPAICGAPVHGGPGSGKLAKRTPRGIPDICRKLPEA